MQLKGRQQFSCGNVKTRMTVDSSTTIPSRIMDQLNGTVQNLVASRVVPACSDLVEEPINDRVYTTVRQTVSYTANGHTVTVEVVLTVFAEGLDNPLNHILAHELIELHALPGFIDLQLNGSTSFSDILGGGLFTGIMEDLIGTITGNHDMPIAGVNLGDLIDSLPEDLIPGLQFLRRR